MKKNIIIFKEKLSEADEELYDKDWYLVYRAENFSKEELLIFYTMDAYDWIYLTADESENIEKIRSICEDEEIAPRAWFNEADGFKPNHGKFKLANEESMKKLFKLWDKYKLYWDDEYYKILKHMYKIYLTEAAIKDIIE